MVTFVKCEKSEVNWLCHSFIFKKIRQLPLFPKSQPFETILIKENEVTSDSSKKKWSRAKESREISLEGFKLNYKRPQVSCQSILQKPNRKKPSLLQEEPQSEVLRGHLFGLTSAHLSDTDPHLRWGSRVLSTVFSGTHLRRWTCTPTRPSNIVCV